MSAFDGFVLGWTLGAGIMWWHFWWHRLIRTRSEWYRDRKARGYEVPENWEEDHPL